VKEVDRVQEQKENLRKKLRKNCEREEEVKIDLRKLCLPLKMNLTLLKNKKRNEGTSWCFVDDSFLKY
jgi:hypothetical protein